MSTLGKPILVGVDAGGTRDGMTLPVGLAALQSFFRSDFRSIAAGVTITVIPILLFFVAVQRYFVRGLSGAVKG